MRAIRNRVIIWQANRRLRKIFKRSFTEGVYEIIKRDMEKGDNTLFNTIENLGLKDNFIPREIDTDLYR